MVNENLTSSTVAEKAEQYRTAAIANARDAGQAAVSAADGYRDTIADKTSGLGDTLSAKASDVKAHAAALADDLKGRASQHASDAKSVVSSMAEDARTKIADIVDQQKSVGADKLSSLSLAAQNAAQDLSQQNPQVARLVRDAATSVDRFAGDLRSSSLSDVVASVSSFARKQPVAFFAGSVLAGFVLARFLKSEPAPVQDDYYDRASRS